MRYPKPYYNASKLQDLIMEASQGENVKELANLARSFAVLEQLKLRIQMKPAPKAIDTTKLEKVVAQTQPSFIE